MFHPQSRISDSFFLSVASLIPESVIFIGGGFLNALKKVIIESSACCFFGRSGNPSKSWMGSYWLKSGSIPSIPNGFFLLYSCMSLRIFADHSVSLRVVMTHY